MLLGLDIALPGGERQLYENDALVILFCMCVGNLLPSSAVNFAHLMLCSSFIVSAVQSVKRRTPEDEEIQLQRYQDLTG